ncbi:type I-E CRISPR-associated protein Cse2/CasB [Catenulispora pinisilvae]|uniref:type I-E CRISPR-associated protein Cse2/CasB n=1 Tax=Catenulispora pinisilvae TaxID=2705253 RepID=UPI001E49DB6E|nr:type I-E CRISPR-associated protein Cse2/CasB [Catenulispora pinisilvae]
MTEQTTKKRPVWFWELFEPGQHGAGRDLAALRAGLGRDAWSVPEMWRLYRAEIPEDQARRGTVTPALEAEHATLTLFALHQQSMAKSMHAKGPDLGVALFRLRQSEQFRDHPEALDQRVGAAATATSTKELVYHLRGLVTLLRGQSIPLDYNRLHRDIRDWDTPEGRIRVRQAWGISYFVWRASEKPEAE